jgi:hypothetical protein
MEIIRDRIFIAFLQGVNFLCGLAAMPAGNDFRNFGGIRSSSARHFFLAIVSELSYTYLRVERWQPFCCVCWTSTIWQFHPA